MKCDICGRTAMAGHAISHSKHHTIRKWEPNVHKGTIYLNGKPKRVNICTRCQRTQTKVAA